MDLVINLVLAFAALSLMAFSLLTFSDGLQALAGHWVYSSLTKPERSSFKWVRRGFWMTYLFQSPLAAIQTIFGLSNAGLLNLSSAFSMLVGANIGHILILSSLICLGLILSKGILLGGTTLILGYLFFRLGKKQITSALGKSFIGLSFIGLSFFLSSIAFSDWQSVMGIELEKWELLTTCYILGLLLVIIFRSSALTYTVACFLFLHNQGQGAFLLMVGGFLGETLSLLMNTKMMSNVVKKVIRIHLLFVLLSHLFFGVLYFIWGDFFLWGFLPYCFGLLLTGVVFLLAQKRVLKILESWSSKNEVPDEKHFEFIGDPKDMMPMAAFIQLERQVVKLGDIVNRMFNQGKNYIHSDEVQPRLMAKIKDYERITDNIKREIIQFSHYLKQKPLGQEQAIRLHSLLKVVAGLESVADYLEKLVVSFTKLKQAGNWEKKDEQDFFLIIESVHQFFLNIVKNIESSELEEKMKHEVMISQAFVLKDEIEELRLQYATKFHEKGPEAVLQLSDLFVAVRKVRSHTRNIGDALL